jgi:hypothetical protein
MLSGNTKSTCLLSALIWLPSVAVLTGLVSHRLAPQTGELQVGAGIKQ